MLGNEGVKPTELLVKGRRELTSYQSVKIRAEQVTAITREAAQFIVTCIGGFTASARKILLTTGLKDEVPQFAGVEQLYGRSVHHCP